MSPVVPVYPFLWSAALTSVARSAIAVARQSSDFQILSCRTQNQDLNMSFCRNAMREGLRCESSAVLATGLRRGLGEAQRPRDRTPKDPDSSRMALEVKCCR